MHPLSRLNVVKSQTFWKVFSKKFFSTATKNCLALLANTTLTPAAKINKKKQLLWIWGGGGISCIKPWKCFGDRPLTVGYSTPRCVAFEVEGNLNIFPLKERENRMILSEVAISEKSRDYCCWQISSNEQFQTMRIKPSII